MTDTGDERQFSITGTATSTGGKPGPQGEPGTSMIAGAGAPTQDMPVGTLYLDSETGDLYEFKA